MSSVVSRMLDTDEGCRGGRAEEKMVSKVRR